MLLKEKDILNFHNELLLKEESFKVDGLGKNKWDNIPNWKLARVFLKDKEMMKKTVERIKSGDIDPSSVDETLRNNLMSLYIAFKIARSKYRQKERSSLGAREILKGLGIDLINAPDKKVVDKIYKESKKAFNYKMKVVETEKPIDKEAKPIIPAKEEPKSVDDEEPEEPAEEPEKEVPERPGSKDFDPKQVPAMIEKLKNDALKLAARKFNIPVENLEAILGEAINEAEDEPSKRQLSGLKSIISKFTKRMDKLARRAQEMPSTAGQQLRFAKSEAFNLQMKGLKRMAPGALKILKQRVAETGKGAVEKTKGAIKRAEEKIGKDPVMQAIGAKFKKGREYLEKKGEQALEKAEAGARTYKEKKAAGVPSHFTKAAEAMKKVRSKIVSSAKEAVEKGARVAKKVITKLTPEQKKRKKAEEERKRLALMPTHRKQLPAPRKSNIRQGVL